MPEKQFLSMQNALVEEPLAQYMEGGRCVKSYAEKEVEFSQPSMYILLCWRLLNRLMYSRSSTVDNMKMFILVNLLEALKF